MRYIYTRRTQAVYRGLQKRKSTNRARREGLEWSDRIGEEEGCGAAHELNFRTTVQMDGRRGLGGGEAHRMHRGRERKRGRDVESYLSKYINRNEAPCTSNIAKGRGTDTTRRAHHYVTPLRNDKGPALLHYE